MCFICDVILCKSCACAKTRLRDRSKNGCNNSIFQKCASKRRSESPVDTRGQETGKDESDGIESKITEASTSYMGVNEVLNTVKCVADRQIMPLVAYDTPAVLGEERISKDDNVQSEIDPTLNGISEHDRIPEMVEESIVKVDEPQLNMCPAMDGSLLGRIMY